MLPLRHARLWRRLSVALLIVVVIGAMSPAFWFDTKREIISWVQRTDLLLHGMTFAVLSLWFAGLIERRAWWVIVTGLMLFGLAIEGCQMLVSYRMADWTDVGANAAGIITGLLLAVAGLGGWGLRVEAWHAGRTQA